MAEVFDGGGFAVPDGRADGVVVDIGCAVVLDEDMVVKAGS